MSTSPPAAPSSPPIVVVIGALDAARRACDALRRQDRTVVHLLEPTEDDLRATLADADADPDSDAAGTGTVEAVAILVRGDVNALRYALLVEHLRPAVRLVVTVFDRTVADQLVRVIPNCQVTSPADVAVPSIVEACLDDRPLRRASPTTRALRLLAGQARSHDSASRILLTGLAGLLTVLAAEWALAAGVLHQSAAEALYTASRIVSTVGLVDRGDAPGWYLVVSGLGMMLTIGFAALFTAGVVERSLSGRSAGIVGARILPRRDHVVVVGLGQVGLRLCLSLRGLGIPVVAVERDPDAANLRLAKAARIPVLIAHAEDRAVLDRLGLSRARALAAMGAEELDNVEVAIAALASAPELRIVLRAGDSDDVITETRSLFPIGAVVDISALTAQAVADAIAVTIRRSNPAPRSSARSAPPAPPAPPDRSAAA